MIDPGQHFATTLKSQTTRMGRFWLSIAAILGLLVAEVAFLTPFVEFSSGAMTYVASPWVCSGLMFTLVAFLLLAGRPTRLAGSAAFPGQARWAALRLPGHGILYLVFVAYTFRLAGAASPLPDALAPLVWLLLAAGVGLTAFLTFLPLRLLVSWVNAARGKVLAAAALGAAYVVLGPLAQSLWPRLQGPAVALDRLLLGWTYEVSAAGSTADGSAALQGNRHLVLVTPGCSELDALAAFWLMGGALVCSRWRDLSRGWTLLALVLGTSLLYVLNAVRLYGLVVVANLVSGKACVALGHSRIGSLLFLGVTTAVLAGVSRWCLRKTPTGESLSEKLIPVATGGSPVTFSQRKATGEPPVATVEASCL